MDFIDRLAGILRSLMRDREEDTPGRAGGRSGGAGGSTGGPGSSTGGAGGSPEGAGQGYRDPDLRAAWEELEDYMRGGSGSGSAGRTGTTGTGSSGGRYRRPEPPADESLRKDFANLEVPFGADIETIRRSYKALVLRYHPDKFAGDPEKQRVALEITKKINESFERIRNRK